MKKATTLRARVARYRWLDLVVRLVEKSVRDQVRDMSAAIAFYSLLSIFPLLISVIALSGYVIDSPSTQARIYEFVDSSFPGSSEFVETQVDAAIRRKGTMTVFGALALLWSSTAAFGAINRSINKVWQAKRNHPIYLSKPRSFLMALAMAVFVIGSVASSALLELLPVVDFEILQRWGLDLSNKARLQTRFASIAFTFFFFALIYKGVPYSRPSWREVLPGALLASVLFELSKAGFLIYLDRAADFEMLYGSLSSIIVLMLWLFLSAMILIVGAEFIAVLSEDPKADGKES